MAERKYITYEEYEDCYQEALLILKERYETVGKPFQLNGQRVCSIKTLTFNEPVIVDDRTIFVLSFGAEIADKIKSIGHQVYVEIEGHTDSTGSAEYNLALGQKRAEAVRQYLHERHQFPLHLIETMSFGETKPVSDNSSRDGRAQNRRVVIRVLDPIAPLMGEMAKAGETGASQTARP